MKRFREHILSRIVTIATAVIFLNMSFFLAELSFLEMEKDSRFTKVISLLILGTNFEEEKEVGGDVNEEDTSKKIDVVFHYQAHALDAYDLISELRWFMNHRALPPGSFQTFTPPPEV